MGYKLVELNHYYTKGSLRIVLVIYKAEGITISDCASVHKTVVPRVEMLKPGKDIYVEICSPGISRTLKSVEELTIFKGLKLRILEYQKDEWSEGIISEVDDVILTLTEVHDSETVEFRINDIQKAKLF